MNMDELNRTDDDGLLVALANTIPPSREVRLQRQLGAILREAWDLMDTMTIEGTRGWAAANRIAQAARAIGMEQTAAHRQFEDEARAALQSIADQPDPLDGKCYCRWSQGLARQVLDRAR